MLKKIGLTLALLGTVALPALALENSALGNVGQLQGIRQFVDARMDSIQSLLSGVTSQITNIETTITEIQACGDQRMFYDSSENCVPLWTYDAAGPSAQFDGQVIIGNPAASSYELDVDGEIRAAGYFHNSDESLKEDFAHLNGLEIVSALEGVHYKWKDTHAADVGLIAQDVEAVLPQLVVTDPASGVKAVDYAKIVAPLVEAVKELNLRLAALEAEQQ